MKMKRVLLKLFLATCFLSAFWHKDVAAASQPSVDLNNGSIYIGKDSTDGEFIGRGSTAAEAKANSLSGIKANHKTGYTFGGIVYDSENITIDLGSKDEVLNLTFNNFRMINGTHLNIKSGTVNITLTGTENALEANAGSPAITISNTAALFFKGGGQFGISGTENQPVISGGGLTIENGAITLNKKGSGDTCTGQYIQVNRQGSLYCNDTTSGGKATLGNIDLYQEGGFVDAAGLYEIDYEKESFSIDKSASPASGNVTIFYKDGDKRPQLDAEVEKGDGDKDFVKINERLFGKKSIEIGRQRLSLNDRTTNSSSAKVAQNETHALEKDGIISGIDVANTEYVYISEETTQPGTPIALADYMKAQNLSWEQFNIDPETNRSPGYYYVRKKSSSTDFASKYKLLHIEPGDILDFEPTPFKFNAVYKNITADTSQKLTILNYGDKDATINTVALKDGQDKSCFQITGGTGSSINGRSTKDDPANKNETISVVPDSDLEVGTYETTIQIGYSLGGNNQSPIEIPVSFKVEKAEQPKPTDALQVTNITYNSATLNGITPNAANTDSGSGVEYSFSTDGEWDGKNVSDKPQFTGKLSPETKYHFLARYKETKNYKASEPISTEGETEKAASINFEEQKLEFPYSDREYTVTVGKDGKPQTYKDVASIDIPDDWCKSKTTITITDVTKNGTQTLTLPALRSAPNPKAVDEMIIGDKGSITSVSTAMEFRKKLSKSKWGEWEDCPGRTIDQVEPGDYQVRTKATSTDFPSAIASITVHKGPSIEVNLQGADFDEIPYGTPTSGKIIIQNRDTVPVKLEGITLSAENFIITEGAKSLEPSASVEWGIQPKEKLNVGTYESDIIVSYDDSQEDDSDDGTDDTNPDDTNPDDTNPDDTTDDTDNKNPDEPQIEGQAANEAEEITENEQSNIRTASIEVKATIVKAPQTDVPEVPSEKSVTATSITLNTIPNNPVTGAKAQYSKDGGRTWQDSPTFTGLSPNREYTFVARYAETDNYNASDISSGEVTITTAEKNNDGSSSDGVNSQANGNNNNSNGSNGSNGTNGTNGNGTGTGTNNGNGTGTGTNSGTDGSSDSSSNGVLSSAKTGDLNNIQLWVALMIGSYLSCAIIIRNRLKKI